MSESFDQHRSQPKAQHDFLVHVLNMPSWHKAVLLLGAILTVAGSVGVLIAKTHPETHPDAPSQKMSATDTTPPGARKMVDTPNTATPTASTSDGPQDTSLFTRLSPHAMKIGGSIVAGFVIGWLFRAFLKTMALLAFLLIGGVWALSHFGILNLGSIDTASVQRHSTEAATWLQAHGEQLKTLLIQHLPSTSGGAVGAFLGFRRR